MKGLLQSCQFAPRFCVQVEVTADTDNVTGATGSLLIWLQLPP